jgi:hypothetical protein
MAVKLQGVVTPVENRLPGDVASDVESFLARLDHNSVLKMPGRYRGREFFCTLKSWGEDNAGFPQTVVDGLIDRNVRIVKLGVWADSLRRDAQVRNGPALTIMCAAGIAALASLVTNGFTVVFFALAFLAIAIYGIVLWYRWHLGVLQALDAILSSVDLERKHPSINRDAELSTVPSPTSLS